MILFLPSFGQRKWDSLSNVKASESTSVFGYLHEPRSGFMVSKREIQSSVLSVHVRTFERVPKQN